MLGQLDGELIPAGTAGLNGVEFGLELGFEGRQLVGTEAVLPFQLLNQEQAGVERRTRTSIVRCETFGLQVVVLPVTSWQPVDTIST